MSTRQAAPFAQAAHAPPPQSTPVSASSLTPSWQRVATQVSVCALQMPDAQSLPILHALPVAHFAGHAPPQSRSVSSPFFTVSRQRLPMHLPVCALQRPERQSLALPQALPWPQAMGHAPPQSTSTSVPFLRPSRHWLSTQVLLVAQKPVAQSAPVPQALPRPQGPHLLPPQSKPVSSPSFTPSLHGSLVQKCL